MQTIQADIKVRIRPPFNLYPIVGLGEKNGRRTSNLLRHSRRLIEPPRARQPHVVVSSARSCLPTSIVTEEDEVGCFRLDSDLYPHDPTRRRRRCCSK